MGLISLMCNVLSYITTLLSQLLGIPSALALVLTLLDKLLIATVGRQMPSSIRFLIEILNLEKISGYLVQNVIKFVTSLSYKKTLFN